tara:strand:+ start:263 stop:598 length:336 start_codon:yes stop_codon:yes gene_type:complete
MARHNGNIGRLFAVCAGLIFTGQVYSQAGGASGYEASIQAIEPEKITLNIGLASTSPPKIGRLIVADSQGASLTNVDRGPTEQSRPVFDAMTQYLVNQGIAVFRPNIRKRR